MNCYLDLTGVYINFDDNRIEWNPSELKENIFLLLGIIKNTIGVRIVGHPYKINKGEYGYAVNFEKK